MKNNPVLIILGGLTPILTGLTAVLTDTFHMDAGGVRAVMVLMAAVLGIVMSLITRQLVTPYNPAVDNTVDSTSLLRLLEEQVKSGVALVKSTGTRRGGTGK